MAYSPPLPGTPETGVLTAIGSVSISPNSGDSVVEVEIFPTPSATPYTGVTLFFEESLDSGASWLSRAMVDLNTQNIVATNNGLSVSDGTTHGWQTSIYSTMTTQFRVRVSAISGGSASFNVKSAASPNNPFAAAVAAGSSGGPGSFSTLTLTGLLTESSQNGLTALGGGGQSGATAITAQVARFTTVVTAGDSGILMASAAGLEVTVINSGANSMDVYPASGDTINAQGANNPYILAAGRLVRFNCAVAGTWNVNPTSAAELNTNITTVGAGTLTAAAIVGGVITRSGSVAAYSDATDTAAAIIAAIPGAATGESWELTIKNTVGFNQTITAGGSVTLSGQTIIPPNSVGRFLVTVASPTTVTMRGLFISPLTLPPIAAQGTLTTVGAGTILAATIADGLLLRTGSTSAFTDTTDTGTAIAGAFPNINIGMSFMWTYQNSTEATATLTGGTGVNSAATFGTVAPGCWATYLFTYTASNTFSVATVNAGSNFNGLPPFKLSTGTTTTTFTAAEMTGGQFTCYTSTATTPGSIATATATAMFAAIPTAFVGMQWIWRVVNNTSGANSMTITADASVTLSGKTSYVITQYGFADFIMTFTSATTANMQFVGAGVGTSN
jgi:hypothetical protein